MKIGPIDTSTKVLVVAEVGNNHEGDFTLAQDMLGEAIESGADAVKFQTFIPERFVSSSDSARIDRLRKFQLSFPQFEKLSQQAAEQGTIFFSTPLDLESARFLNTIQAVFKIASGDNNFIQLIREIAGFGKPTIVSTGLSSFEDIDQVCELWRKHANIEDLALLHCVASYPVPLREASLAAIRSLQVRYPKQTVGYSDHTLGVEAALFSVAVGARIVEKHFTLDKAHSDFRDHHLSADPAEFKQLVNSIRELEEILGNNSKTVQECEGPLTVVARRSIAASSDLEQGTVLANKHLMWVRPGGGFPPGQEGALIGKTLSRPVKMGDLLYPQDVK
eukprot:TRINITY_DN23598_c0_g1_i1.p1 TRINITY_DN23598_c0_g1~~TRINITY_DN23598_c0_g1_i1.p1  ORF type:complete len:334 (-),score=-4.61 TRINITY_DN23598_c0_g1_i1:92-1093(-)